MEPERQSSIRVGAGTSGRCRTACYTLLCVLASWVAGTRAPADLLIESYRDARPVDADRILGPLRDELARGGVEVRPSVIAAAGEPLPLPGVADPSVEPHYPGDPARQVEIGATQVLRGDYEIGLVTLDAVLRSARENPARVAADPTSPTWLTKAYAAVAFAQLRSQRTSAAIEAVAEQIRSFPEAPIGRIVGPDVAALSDSVRKRLDGSPHGDLHVTASRPDVQVFINDRLRPSESTVSLVPGAYRVLLVRAGVARRYRIVVAADRRTDLDVDWDADAAFNATSQWAGFTWLHGQDDKTDAAVARYARAGRVHDLLVVGVAVRGDRRLLTGEIFEKRTGALVRRRAIELGHEDDRCGRALAQYLLKGDLSNCLVDVPDSRANATTSGTSGTSRISNADKLDLHSREGVVVNDNIAGSMELLPRRQDGGERSRVLPYSLLVGGVILAGVGAVLIAIDEDPGPDKSLYIRDSARTGAGLAVGGAVLAGAAAYLLWFRSPNPASNPVVTLGRDAAYIGWIERF